MWEIPLSCFKAQYPKRRLPQVVLATRPARRLPRLLNRRQQQTNEHTDDGDHDQQLNQGETMTCCSAMTYPAVYLSPHGVTPEKSKTLDSKKTINFLLSCQTRSLQIFGVIRTPQDRVAKASSPQTEARSRLPSSDPTVVIREKSAGRSSYARKRPDRGNPALIVGSGTRKYYRTTRAPPPAITFSTSLRVAIEVSPGVVDARAPWAAP